MSQLEAWGTIYLSEDFWHAPLQASFSRLQPPNARDFLGSEQFPHCGAALQDSTAFISVLALLNLLTQPEFKPPVM